MKVMLIVSYLLIVWLVLSIDLTEYRVTKINDDWHTFEVRRKRHANDIVFAMLWPMRFIWFVLLRILYSLLRKINADRSRLGL